MELRTDRMKMGEVERLGALLARYKKVPASGVVYGLTSNAKESFFDHDEEEKWEEMMLLFVTPSHGDIKLADSMFVAWANREHGDKPLLRVGDDVQPGASRYWIYILR